MSGFVVTYRPSSEPPSSDNSAAASRLDVDIDISGAGVERLTTNRNHIALIDGYALGVSSQRLVAALESHDDEFLSGVHGNYCVLVIRPDGNMQGYCDRFGAKTLYWQVTQQHGIKISSRWPSMPVFERQWDDLGLAEMLRYRCMSGQNTLITGVSKLPNWQRVSIARNGEISVHKTAQQPEWPTNIPAVPFGEKLDETRSALTNVLGEVAQSYDNAAIFLSGGVDSSLLAALSKSCFKKCLLVSAEFPGENNPELDTARSFAKTLQLEHLIVEIDQSRLEQDLRYLTAAKGGQINFHSLAIHQMVKAIPTDYQVLIHGESADTLFGSGDFKQTEMYLRWKQYANFLPAFGWEWISRLPIHRVKKLCRLMQASKLDVTLQKLQIQYDPQSKEIIRNLYNARLDDLYAHQAVVTFWSTSDAELRGMLQDLTLACLSANHFREADLSATQFGKHVLIPYLAKPVVNAAKGLTRGQYFGTDSVKPILRELACEHFERESIYKKKRGFEVPVFSWLNGPLANLVKGVREERYLFDGRLLSGLDVEPHYSLFWTLICWQMVNDHITNKSGA